MTVKPVGWVLIVGAVAGGLLLWSAHATDAASVSWTDPGQPPAMVALPIGACGSRLGRPRRSRDYPDTLSSWPDCVIGDC